MQLPKVVLSWLSSILLALTALISVLNGVLSATGGATSVPLIAKITGIAGVIVLVVRNIMNDFGGSSDPAVAAAAQAGAVAGAQAAQKIVASS